MRRLITRGHGQLGREPQRDFLIRLARWEEALAGCFTTLKKTSAAAR